MTTAGVSGLRVAESVALTVLRVGLGGLMLYAGWPKLHDPQVFAEAIKGYGWFDPATQGHAIITLAYTIPWSEVICGLLLILGGWARGSSLLLAAQFAAFAYANWTNWGKECTCFGDKDPFCGDQPIGECHMVRNGVLLATALLLAWRGAGMWGLDAMLSRKRRMAAAGAEDLDGDEVVP